MNEMLRHALYDEANRIGEALVASAERDANGMFWKSLEVIPPSFQQTAWFASESLYNGGAGIALFLIELYKHTGRDAYLRVAAESLRWCVRYCQKNPTAFYGFMVGRMGVCYVLTRLAEATGDDLYLAQALALADGATAFLETPDAYDDFLRGRSGALLGLLHLHAATGERGLLPVIDQYIEVLIQGAHHGPAGLFWERSRTQAPIHGLCGFSHGAAGIGFVFLELGHYFQNDAFYWMAQQAFLYEAVHFDEQKKNWPDFRILDDAAIQQAAYQRNDMAYFTTAPEMIAWCHGAPGIGLSRLRAYELIEDPACEAEAQTALLKTYLTGPSSGHPSRSHTLCHGSAGNAEIFLEAYRIFGEARYRSWAERAAEQALASNDEGRGYRSGYAAAGDAEDTSLFMGKAGIGYFYLRVLAPLEVPSVLAPRLTTRFTGDATAYGAISISTADMHRVVMSTLFERTLSIATPYRPEAVTAYFEQASGRGRPALKPPFCQFVEHEMGALPEDKAALLADVFSLESSKVAMDEAIPSYTFLAVKNQVVARQARQHVKKAPDAFQALYLRVDPDVQIKTTCWNGDGAARDAGAILLKPNPEGIQEQVLSSFSEAVLGAFGRGRAVGDVVREMVEALQPEASAAAIAQAVIGQVKQALLGGMLVEVTGAYGFTELCGERVREDRSYLVEDPIDQA